MTRLRLVAWLMLVLGAAGAAAESTVIVGATVHTMGPRGTLENATIFFEDGRIVSVGRNPDIPDTATRIDAAGKVVTPGLFSPFGNLGLVEVSLSAGPLDAVQRGDAFSAGFDVADAYNRRSTLIGINRIEGVTRALITPRPGGPNGSGDAGHVLSGLAAIVNLGDEGTPVDRRAAAMVVSLGESGSRLAEGSRAAALLVLRNALEEAIDYRDHRDEFERGARRPYRHSVADLEALQDVLSGETPLLVNVHRASDIEALLRLVGEYGVRAVVRGGAEAWMLAEQLAAANVAVVLAPQDILPEDFDRINARRETAAILSAAGVRISFADARAHTHNARNITQSAGNAVAFGLSWADALRAITLAPAEIFGIADRTGSIEPGKDADIVIWPGDPLELTNYPERVFIKGEPIPMTSRQTLLRDRYLQTESGLPPAFRPPRNPRR